MWIQPSRVAKPNINRQKLVDYSILSNSDDPDWKRSGDEENNCIILVDDDHDDNEDLMLVTSGN
jgi:hypothetical protein